MKICVFCSSSNGVSDLYFKTAEKLGELIGKNKHSLVYGGANVGLMETVAIAVKNNNGYVLGVIPQKINDNNLSSSYNDELIITDTMNERKKIMGDKSDAFVALPGGFGTLEEILEVITQKQLDYHQKPIVFLNTNGFFDNLFLQFEKSFSDGFAKTNYRKLYSIVDSPKEVIEYIESYAHKDLGTKWFNVPEK